MPRRRARAVVVRCLLLSLAVCGATAPIPAQEIANVRPLTIADTGLVGDFHTPAAPVKKTGVLLLGGSGGGKPGHWLAGELTQHGYAVLGLAYFNAEGLSPTLERIPIEYAAKGVGWLREQTEPRCERVVVIGGSKGAELALVLAAHFSTVNGVIAIAPSSMVWQGLPADFTTEPPRSSWTLHGQPLPFLTCDFSADFDPQDPLAIFKAYDRALDRTDADTAAAMIPVERIRGSVLLISGRDDTLWPAPRMADAILARLATHAFRFSTQHISYPEAGHTLSEQPMLGGTPEGNRKAHADLPVRVLEFLDHFDAAARHDVR